MGQFRKYIAVSRVSLGLTENKNAEHIVIEEGDVVAYDGRTAKIGDDEHYLPRLKSAISARWLVDEEELLTGAVQAPAPISAHIEMRGATPDKEAVVASTAVSEEERDVGSLSEVRARGRYENPKSYQVESQGGVTVRQGFKSKAFGEGGGADAEPLDVSSVSSTSTVALETEAAEEKAAQFDAIERQKYERKIAELQRKLAERSSAPQVREGIQFEEPTNISASAAQTTALDPDAEQIWDGGDAPVVSAPQPEAPSADEIVANKEARLALARQMMPNFDWDFSVNWRRKLKLLEESGNPLLVCTVYAVESDAMKGHIAEKFPQYNLGT